MKNRKFISVLLSFSLIFGTVLANAVSISFDEIIEDDISILYEELETEDEIIAEEDTAPSLATEIDYIDENIETVMPVFYNTNRIATIPITTLHTASHTRNQATDALYEYDYRIGRYQFNIASAGVYAEDDDGGIYSVNTGLSHILTNYEVSRNSAIRGNSSGCYLDKNYSIVDGTESKIVKAYLVLNMSTITYKTSIYQYPIRLIYAGEDKIPQSGIETTMDVLYYAGHPSNDHNAGIVDVTDFVKENGYGWYYCCNIPTETIIHDACAGWKLILIEENEKLPVRMMKLMTGNKFCSSSDRIRIDISGKNVTSKKSGNVTGQFFYSMMDNDSTPNANSVYFSPDGVNFKNIFLHNELRSLRFPLSYIQTRNGKLLNTHTNYEYPRYVNIDSSSRGFTTSVTRIPVTGPDMAFFDIDGTTDEHNILLENNQPMVSFRYHTAGGGWVLTTEVAGVCADIDAPEYTTVQTSNGHNQYYATIKGTTTNTSTLTDGIGLNNGKIVVSVDKQLKILSTNAIFTDENGNEFPLNSDMYTIDEENNTITYTFGKDANGKSMIGEFLTYEIETVALEADTSEGYKTIANNEVQVSGYLISNNYVTDYWMNKVAWDTSSVQINNPPKVLETTLKINPNGGLYENSPNVKEITDLEHHTSIELSVPERKGYTFIGWEVPSDSTTVINKNVVTIGYEDVEIKAKWKINQYTLTINPNGGTIDGNSNTITKILDYRTETELPTPVRPGYVFIGWESSIPDVEIIDNKITISDKDITFTAKWVLDSFDVTYIDVTLDGKELGKQVIKKNYNSTVRGSDIGADKTDNAYYIGYGLESWTESIVSLDGATVYRTFEYRTIDMTSNLHWNDNNNLDGFRPQKYKLKLKQNGKVIDEVELSSEQIDYTFPELPKYDEAGNPYHYTFDVDASDRYQINFDNNGNLIIEDYLPANFSIIIPKQIVLDGKTGEASYTVSVDGTFYYNDALTVIPENSLILSDRSNISNMKANVSLAQTQFKKEDVNSVVNGTISTNKKLFAGSWRGNFNFNIKFVMSN